MIQEKSREFVHSWYVLIMTFFSLLYLLMSKNFLLDLALVFFMLTIFLRNGLRISTFKRLLLYAFLFSFGLFILNVFHPSAALKSGEVYHVGYFEIYQASLAKASGTMVRLFFVSLLSMSSGVAINYTKVVLYLIVNKGLKLFWGYPILLALNSIALFKKEYERIKINARLRNLPLRDRISLFFPLLVFAIRHSQRGALSLVTRGLNEQKSFYFSYEVSPKDKQWLKLFWLLYLLLVSITLFPLG